MDHHIIDEHSRCAVVGYGSWATALVKILAAGEQKVGWYIPNREVREHIARHGANPRYLCDVRFDPSRLDLSDDLDRTARNHDILILATPSAFLADTLAPLTEPLRGKMVVSAIKGIVPGDYLTVSEFVNRRYGLPYDSIGIVAGPSHSEEVALERLSYLTLVCKDIGNAEALCRKFTTEYIRTHPSTDIFGAEYAAVLKNIYALAAGICAGLGYGDNFMAVLVSNGAMEMSDFLARSHAAVRDTNASAYLGDLLVTCYSQFSRNRRFGEMIGRGGSVRSAMDEMKMVAEGYYASATIGKINERVGADMPIADAVHDILYGGRPARETVAGMTKKLF